MQLPKTKSLGLETGFGVGNILGVIFLLIGILLILSLVNLNLPINLSSLTPILQYGAALGSILGGLAMIFKKKDSVPDIK